MRSFTWRLTQTAQRWGGIAQEIVDVVPEMVRRPADQGDSWSLDWSKAVPMLIKDAQDTHAALDRAHEAIEQLLDRVTALEGK